MADLASSDKALAGKDIITLDGEKYMLSRKTALLYHAPQAKRICYHNER